MPGKNLQVVGNTQLTLAADVGKSIQEGGIQSQTGRICKSLVYDLGRWCRNSPKAASVCAYTRVGAESCTMVYAVASLSFLLHTNLAFAT